MPSLTLRRCEAPTPEEKLPRRQPARGRSALVSSASQWDYADISGNAKRCYGVPLPAAWQNKHRTARRSSRQTAPAAGTHGKPALPGVRGNA